jgi:hypothetical protein
MNSVQDVLKELRFTPVEASLPALMEQARMHSVTSDTKLPSSVRFFVSTEVRRARLIFHDRSQLSMMHS